MLPGFGWVFRVLVNGRPLKWRNMTPTGESDRWGRMNFLYVDSSLETLRRELFEAVRADGRSWYQLTINGLLDMNDFNRLWEILRDDPPHLLDLTDNIMGYGFYPSPQFLEMLRDPRVRFVVLYRNRLTYLDVAHHGDCPSPLGLGQSGGCRRPSGSASFQTKTYIGGYRKTYKIILPEVTSSRFSYFRISSKLNKAQRSFFRYHGERWARLQYRPDVGTIICRSEAAAFRIIRKNLERNVASTGTYKLNGTLGMPAHLLRIVEQFLSDS